MIRKIIIAGISAFSFTVYADVSPYAGQEQRQIKALSQQEIQGLLQGHGMGLAKAGELNQYPGPKHVLELADKLGLSREQLEQTQNLYRTMQKNAMSLGKKIINKEQQLDQLFADKTVSEKNLKQVLLEIGQLRAELRFVHLKAHLQQKAVLSEKQVHQYVQLRGYTGSHHEHDAHKHHH